jgi:hypothetical protein
MSKTRLLELSGGGLSLEIDSTEWNMVAEKIRDLFGAPKVELLAATHAIHKFGGAEFIFQDVWGDPCLISKSEQGDAILRQLAAALSSN